MGMGGQLMSMASVVVSWSLCSQQGSWQRTLGGRKIEDCATTVSCVPPTALPQLPAFHSKLFPLITTICDSLKVRATKTLVGSTPELPVVSRQQLCTFLKHLKLCTSIDLCLAVSKGGPFQVESQRRKPWEPFLVLGFAP